MSADEFFEKHSIEEINKKTKISSISLRFIKNKEFDKLPRVKFVGFVRLIEKRYKVDLSDLIEEYDNYFKENKKEDVKEVKKLEDKKDTEKTDKKSYLWALVVIFLIISVFLYINYFNNKHNIGEKNVSSLEDKNFTFTEKANDNNITTKISNAVISNDFNKSKINNSNKIVIKEYNITIIPQKRVWFRALNVDNNKTKEYLTSHKVILKGNYYLKFGHGNIIIKYNDENITPKSNKVVRILLRNGEYKFLKKPNKYEK